MNVNEMFVVRIAQPGLDGNSLIWPGHVLRKAVPLFEGKPVYPAHPAGRVGTDRWGYLRSVQFVGDDDAGYLCALVRPYDGRISALLRSGVQAGRPYGVSMHADNVTTYRPKGRGDVAVVTEIKSIRSVDLVREPAIIGARILTEASGVPIPPNDQRVVGLLEGRQETTAEPPRRNLVAIREAIVAASEQVAEDFLVRFQARHGPGPWRIRSA